MVFDATPGGNASNTYVTLEEAAAYFQTRLHSDLWEVYINKAAALVTSTKLLDRYVNWSGVRATELQSLHWPANNVVDQDGYYVAHTIIPDLIKEATCEMAYFILEEDPTVLSDLDGIHSLKIGSLQIVADHKNKSTTIPEAIWKTIGVYGSRPSPGQVSLVRC